jgi:D-amino-acid oxidase
MHDLAEQVVVSCTALGARPLQRQPDVDYIYLANGLYMFPRNDGIVLGGTFDRGDWSLAVDPAQQARILTGHAAIYRSL